MKNYRPQLREWITHTIKIDTASSKEVQEQVILKVTFLVTDALNGIIINSILELRD